ncbi:hypothetical protein EON80_32455, partial [bacterium]
MIPLGLRLALSNDSQTRGRLIGTVIGLMLSTLLLLLLAAAVNGLGRRDARGAWQTSSYIQPNTKVQTEQSQGMLWKGDEDYFGNSTIRIIKVDDESGKLALPPGLSRWPHHGEYFLSPGLASLIAKVPANQLGDRFPGEKKGLLGKEALRSV